MNVSPFADLWDQLRSLQGASYFSQLDLNTGYYQIPIKPSDQGKTGIVTHKGHFEFTRMPFGLTNAPRIFQAAMIQILGHLSFVKIFLDDVLIFSQSLEEHKNM